MKKIIFIIAMLAYTPLFSQMSANVNLKDGESLVMELPKENGLSIYRSYQKDGYVDLIITEDGDVNGLAYFYNPKKVSFLEAYFVQGNGNISEENLLFRYEDKAPDFDYKNTLLFGVANSAELNKLKEKHQDFDLVVVFIIKGERKVNYVPISF